MFGKVLGNLVKSEFARRVYEWRQAAMEQRHIRKYLRSGRKPWSQGYREYKKRVLSDVLGNRELLEEFVHKRELPKHYGARLDERVVEYPWAIGKLGSGGAWLLDAGSALNREYLLSLPVLRSKSIVMYNLSPEGVVLKKNVSYVYGDLRETLLRNEWFDEVVCISTLEHVGMDNTFLYSGDSRLSEFKPGDYEMVVTEFKRVLKLGGRALITVPYGQYENHGWLQQFDRERVGRVLDVFGGSAGSVTYYRYSAEGWQLSDADACADCRYFDTHRRPDYEADYVAAARAVACIEMVK